MEASKKDWELIRGAVSESQEKINSIISSAGNFIIAFDNKGRLVFYQPNCSTYSCIPANKFIGESYKKIMPAHMADMFAKAFDKNRMGETVEYEYWLENGSAPKWFHAKISPVANNNNFRGSMAVIRDITALKRTEEMLCKNTMGFNDTPEDALAWIWEVDASGKYTYTNHVVKNVLGYEEKEIIKKFFYDLFPSEDRKQQKRVLFKLFSRKEPFREVIIRNRHKNGKTVWLSRSGIPMLDKKGDPLGYRGADTDITKWKKTEEELYHNLKKRQKFIQEVVQALASTVEMSCFYTGRHQRRVASIAFAIAKEMKLTKEQSDTIRLSALIHDLGKIHIPAEIVSKPARLNETELGIIRTHPDISFNILKKMKFLEPIAQIVLQHHEKINGSGYPHGLLGEKILLESKVLTVADVVEAMMAHRPYRTALSLEEALKELLKNKGVFYEPDVVDVCVKLFKEKRISFKE